jgi:hypothetical protein
MTLAAPNLVDAEMGERKLSFASVAFTDTPAYWETEHHGHGVSQAYGAMPEDDDEMPLVPRPTQRRLGKVNSPSPEEGASESLTRRRGVASQLPPSTQRPSRATRGTSVASDVSSAPSTRSRAKAPPTRAKPAAKGKRSTKEPVVVEDSEEEVAIDLDKTPSLMTTPATARTKSRAGVTRATTSTLEADHTSRGRSTRPTQPSVVPGTSAISQSMTGRTRRKLLVDDDDEDEIMVSALDD